MLIDAVHLHTHTHTLHDGLQDVGHEALNRACKALAVCRKYLTDSQPGLELSFLPVNRSNDWGHTDPGRFSFLVNGVV